MSAAFWILLAVNALMRSSRCCVDNQCLWCCILIMPAPILVLIIACDLVMTIKTLLPSEMTKEPDFIIPSNAQNIFIREMACICKSLGSYSTSLNDSMVMISVC
ncbi:hypothetical protein SAY87_015584 [Trapa incisa]|uniref:Uncharacterized protein n=1 Tax=Trapa incisa TaxID=236973 RepID=A0AAN7QY61_9MYRT|nr:hypothetical protein SAY87_015584 [Trapa incisa]